MSRRPRAKRTLQARSTLIPAQRGLIPPTPSPSRPFTPTTLVPGQVSTSIRLLPPRPRLSSLLWGREEQAYPLHITTNQTALPRVLAKTKWKVILPRLHTSSTLSAPPAPQPPKRTPSLPGSQPEKERRESLKLSATTDSPRILTRTDRQR